MAITAANLSYIGQAPVAGGSATLAFGGSSCQELSYIGTVTFTGDGSLTAATLNLIDGTASLGFTPTGFLAFRVGGNTTSTIAVASIVPVNGVTATVNFTVAPTNGGTITLAVFVLK